MSIDDQISAIEAKVRSLRTNLFTASVNAAEIARLEADIRVLQSSKALKRSRPAPLQKPKE